MISKERNLAVNLIYSWVQEHTTQYTLTLPGQSDNDIERVAQNLKYMIQSEGLNIDLLSLVDRIELLLRNKSIQTKATGCMCVKCKQWYDMALPNQTNGTLICYSCRNP